MTHLRTCGAAAVLLLLAAGNLIAAEIAVGPGKPFPRTEDALARAQSGDTILVYPQAGGAAYTKPAVYVTKSRITFKAAAPGVALSGKGYNYSGSGSVPRAIFQFNPGADGCVLDGFDLSGAHNDSHNGAGVRINQANDVTVRNCTIHDNDMGIMSSGDGTPRTAAGQLIESCLIHSNGNLADPGYNHNLYLGGTSVTLIGCEVRSSLTGHNVKSRAHLTVVAACYIHDSSNREFDLVDAKGDTTARESNAFLAGNVIVKAPRCEGNRGVIHFGQDGGSEHDGTLTLLQNTIVTPYVSPVVALDAAKARAFLQNNIIWDAGSGQRGQVLVDFGKAGKDAVKGTSNWAAAGFAADVARLDLARVYVAKSGQAPPFVNAAKGDYCLARADPTIIDVGEALDAAMLAPLAAMSGKLSRDGAQDASAGHGIGGPAAAGATSGPAGPILYQYKPPLAREDRPARGKPDLGAYEFAGDGPLEILVSVVKTTPADLASSEILITLRNRSDADLNLDRRLLRSIMLVEVTDKDGNVVTCRRFLRLFGAGPSNALRSHGFRVGRLRRRAAPPVATPRGPVGAEECGQVTSGTRRTEQA